ncbi:MAG: autotransporter-associated beta strand repeat-containing protein, partial [Kiritimatiellae bacterium]|nr:autotransporter-associated beta strand repeat-containing protein [Kiritimatiellia bacterium]
ANVPVAVDGPTTVGGLSLAGGAAANGYMFSGGLLEVATARAGRSLPIVAASGAHTFASPVALGTRTLVDTSVGASIVFAGGVSANSTVLVVNRGHATGGGEVAVHDPQGLAILATGCGRTVVDNLGFVTASNKLEIGRGTLRYTGPDATIAGFRLVNGAGYPAVLDISEGRTLGVKAITASGTAFVKIGAGCLKFTGNGTFTLGDVTHDFASYATVNVAANGDSPTSGHRRFTLSQGRVVQGTAGDPNDAPTVVCTDFCIGNDSVSGEDCEYVMNNGLLNVGSHYIDYYHGGSKLGRTTFTMNGGTITSSWVRTVHSGNKKMYTMPRIVINGGEWIDKGSLVMGYQKIQQAGYTSTMEVNGGRMSVGGTFYLVYHDQTATGNSNKTTDGLLVVNGGELDVKGPLDFCRAASNVGTVWLNGGVFAAENVTMTRGKGYLYFNGGTYAPHGAEDANSTLAGITAAYVTTNGAVISTANAGGGEYTVAQPLLHDPALAGADGGLVKTGGGLLTLAGENTYTGPTAVEGGTLLIAGSVASDELVLRGDGSIDMGGGTMTFANVTALDGALAPQAVNGTLRVGGRLTVGSLFSTTNLAFATGATLAMDAGGLLLVDGDLTCEGALTVDFGRTEEDPLEYGMKIPLAEVTGTVTLPRRIVAANVGIDPVQLAASVENEVLCVTVASRGMTLVIR